MDARFPLKISLQITDLPVSCLCLYPFCHVTFLSPVACPVPALSPDRSLTWAVAGSLRALVVAVASLFGGDAGARSDEAGEAWNPSDDKAEVVEGVKGDEMNSI